MSSSVDAEPTTPRLLLAAGGLHLECDLDVVEEVTLAGAVVPIQHGPPWLAGLTAWRGRVLTVVDAGVLFGGVPATGPWLAVLKGLPVLTALRFDEDPRLAGEGRRGEVVLDRAQLAAHEAFQPGAARPRPAPDCPES